MKLRPYKAFDKRECRNQGTNKKPIRTMLNRKVRQRSRLVLTCFLESEIVDENDFLVVGVYVC